MKIKAAELEGTRLDYWVIRAAGHILKDSLRDGWQEVRTNDGAQYFLGFLPSNPNDKNLYEYEEFYSPSTSWQDGGPIIEDNAITVTPVSDAEWKAEEHITLCQARGFTYLIAAMRCFVASKFGEEVEE